MSNTLIRIAGLLAAATICANAASAAAETPKPTDILFEQPHIASIAAGTELVYKFVRKPSDEKLLGAGFTDNIVVEDRERRRTRQKKCAHTDVFGRSSTRAAADHGHGRKSDAGRLP